MRTALLLSGHMRTWKQLKDNFKTTFMDRYQPDIYISTWNDFGFWTEGPNPTTTGVNMKSPRISLEERHEMFDFYQAKKFEYNEYSFYDPIFEARAQKYLPNCEWGPKDDPKIRIRPKNAISQYYKRQQVVALMEQNISLTGQKYDLVILTRPDVEWTVPMPEFDGKKFHTCVHRNHRGEGTGDLIFVGNSDMISAFSKMIWYFDELNAGIGRFCPHIFVHTWITHLKLPFEEKDLPHTLWGTPTGEYKEWDEKK